MSKLVEVDPELPGIARIERVLGIDEGTDAAALLRFRHRMQRQRRLARGLRPVDLDHPAARQAADAQRDIEAERAARNRFDIDHLVLPELHHRALAEGPVDLAEGGFERLLLVHRGGLYQSKIALRHCRSSLFHTGCCGATDPLAIRA
jgi:hypothetical protein